MNVLLLPPPHHKSTKIGEMRDLLERPRNGPVSHSRLFAKSGRCTDKVGDVPRGKKEQRLKGSLWPMTGTAGWVGVGKLFSPTLLLTTIDKDFLLPPPSFRRHPSGACRVEWDLRADSTVTAGHSSFVCVMGGSPTTPWLGR